MNTSTEIKNIMPAFIKAQGEISGAVKNSKNPFYKNAYADLTAVWDSCREALQNNGLGIIQTVDHENKSYLTTRLVHESGEWIESKSILPHREGDVQSLGSAITYMRRYNLVALLGICSHDDDGEAAMRAVREKDNEEKVAFESVTQHLNEQDVASFLEHLKSTTGKTKEFFKNWWCQTPKAMEAKFEEWKQM